MSRFQRRHNFRDRRNSSSSPPKANVWLVLHRREASGQNCAQLQGILSEELGAYGKNGYDVEALKRTVMDAIARAERMDTPPQDPWPRKQGTHVYRLVRKLVTR